MAWPHRETDWHYCLEEIERDYIELAAAIAGDVPPVILCRDEAHRDHVGAMLDSRCNAILIVRPYNDTWCRDYGPLTLQKGEGDLQLLDFTFDGWGQKYRANLDNEINRGLADCWQAPLNTIDFEMEGGSIETDGCGTLLTTGRCLLQSQRNRGLSRDQIEELVLAKLGLKRALWVNEGMLMGDDTDSHIDNLARFCDARTIAFATCDDPADPHYEPFQKMEKELKSFTTMEEEPYRLVPVPIPPPQLEEDGERLPASYVNFLILNRRVIMPCFDCARDEEAKAALQSCFPHKEVVMTPGRQLIRQFGGPHCATMQLPHGVLKPEVLSP